VQSTHAKLELTESAEDKKITGAVDYTRKVKVSATGPGTPPTNSNTAHKFGHTAHESQEMILHKKCGIIKRNGPPR
jgi:hypothetical protein